jgi:hypothetical protein
MFIKIVTLIWYFGLALFFFGIGFPYLEIILALCACIFVVVNLQG